MYHPHAIIVFLLSTHLSSILSIDVTYEELVELDATCHTIDTCEGRRKVDSLDKYTCHCNSECYKLGTCCVDSRYRDRPAPKRKPSCRSPNGKDGFSYFMVDDCPSGRNKNSMFESMCKEDWKEDDNLQSLVPVTSLASFVTYKNYFCFRCNEATEKFLYWNVKLNANGKYDKQLKDIAPAYDVVNKMWTAAFGKNGEAVPVVLFFEIPDEIRTLPKVCVPNAISNCSAQYRVKDVKSKCGIYTAYIYIPKDGPDVVYRNPHCALCNFENLEIMGCAIQVILRTQEKRPFSFTQLLDINRIDGDKVGMIERCDEDATWDPFFKKCRTLKCAIPGYKIKERKCVPP